MRFNAVLIILGLLAASSCECSPSVVSDRDAGGTAGGGTGAGGSAGTGGGTGAGGSAGSGGGGQGTGGSGGGAAALDGGQCPSDYFRTAQGCVSVTRCTLTQFETTPPTATSDRVCQPLKDCGVAGYQQQPPTATTDRVCAALTVCQASEYQSRPPSATSDRACTAVSTCAATQFEAAAPTATSDRLCQAVRSCTPNEYEAAAPTATRDRVCNTLTSCTAVQFQTAAPTATTDRTCANLTVCTGTQYETVPATATSDRTCAALTVCTATQCETVLPTATRDRQCAPAVLELSPVGPTTLAMTLGQAAPTLAFEARACGSLVNGNWTVDDGAAALISPGPSSSATFTPTGAAGGLVTVTAGYRGLTARSTVRVNLSGTQNGATPAQQAQVPTTVGALVAGGGVGGVGGEGLGPTLPAADAKLVALQGAPTSGASRNLRLLYPYDSTVWPRGMLAPLLQWEWTPGDADAIRIDLSTTSGSFTWSGFFGRPVILNLLPVANRKFIRHPIPQNIWDIATNTAGKPTAAGPADKLNLTVTLVSGTTAYGPLSQTWGVAPARLTGTIYYQSYGTNLASNFTGALGTPSAFGAAVLSIRGGDTGPRLVSSASNCQVCHSVAARGARLVTQASTNGNSDTFAYELTPTGSTNAQLSKGVPSPGYPGLSPDGALMLTPGGALQSLPSNAGANLPISGLSAVSTDLGVPAFSPSGAKVVFNPQNGVANPGRVLVVMDFNKATGAFSNPVTVKNDALTTPGDANVRPTWPQFLPDSNAVLFQEQLKVSADGNSGDAHTRKFARGRIQTVSAISSAAVNPLYKLNGLAPDGTTSTLPRLNVASTLSCTADTVAVGANAAVADGDPTHTFDNAYNYEPTVSPVISGGYAWVVFTSRRLYGNVATIPPFCSDPRGVDLHADLVSNTNITTKKLWVAAVSLNGQAGADTSNPAFYLPAQELLAGNARGFWVLDPCRSDGVSCLTGDQCCNGFCQPNGAGGALVCSNAPRDFTCSNLQEACTTSSDCCLATAQCIGGFCAGE